MVNEERRSFLRWATHGLGILFAAVLGIPAIAYLVDARNRPAAKRDFRKVHGLKLDDEQLLAGVPKQGTIRDDRRDAWTLSEDVIGRVWVVKKGDTFDVFTTICPHLGCSINLDPPPPNFGFTCPCHGGKFTRDGSLDTQVANNPAPRGMDTLEWQRDPADSTVLLVKYQNFYQGRHDKVPKT